MTEKICVRVVCPGEQPEDRRKTKWLLFSSHADVALHMLRCDFAAWRHGVRVVRPERGKEK